MTKYTSSFNRRAPWTQSRLHGQPKPSIEKAIKMLIPEPQVAKIASEETRIPTFSDVALDLEDMFASLSGDLLRDFNEKRRPSFDPEIIVSADARILVVDSMYRHTRNVFALRVERREDILPLLEFVRRDEDVATVSVAIIESGSAIARMLEDHLIRSFSLNKKR